MVLNKWLDKTNNLKKLHGALENFEKLQRIKIIIIAGLHYTHQEQ